MHTVSIVGFVIGLLLVAIILNVTYVKNKKHFLVKSLTEWPLQLKIRVGIIFSILMVLFVDVAEFVRLVNWRIEPNYPEVVLVGFFTTLLFTCQTFATVERYKTYLKNNAGRLGSWLRILVLSEFVSGVLMTFIGNASVYWVSSVELKALLWWISLFFKLYFVAVLIGLDIVCNLKMIRFFISNQIDLEALSQDSELLAQKIFFKHKMMRLFTLLIALDILALIVNVAAGLIPSLNTADIQLAVYIWTAVLIYPLHILIMFSLLSMFKDEVLRKKGTSNASSSKSATKHHNTENAILSPPFLR